MPFAFTAAQRAPRGRYMSAIARLLPAPGSDVARFGTWLLRLVAYLLVALIALVIGFALAQPLSGPALERIVTGQERALGGRDHPPHGGWSGALRSLRVTLVSLLITLPLLLLLTVVDLAFPPAAIVTTPMKFAVSAMMVSWDLLDYPLSRRGFGVRRRVAWIGDHFGATLGFGLSLSVLFLIPCAGLLLLPAGVAGAARLVVEEERHSER